MRPGAKFLIGDEVRTAFIRYATQAEMLKFGSTTVSVREPVWVITGRHWVGQSPGVVGGNRWWYNLERWDPAVGEWCQAETTEHAMERV